jgi:hypothetical protein
MLDDFLASASPFRADSANLPMKALLTLIALAMLTASTIAADGPIRHVVHFKFKKEATPEQVKKITEEFAALKGKISEVESLEWGTNSSPGS